MIYPPCAADRPALPTRCACHWTVRSIACLSVIICFALVCDLQAADVQVADVQVAGQTAEHVVAVKVAKIYVGDGRVIDDGVILIRSGRIVAVGTGVAVPEGAMVVEFKNGCVTPGLIDANARVASQELVPTSRVASTLIPRSDEGADDHGHADMVLDGAVAGERAGLGYAERGRPSSADGPEAVSGCGLCDPLHIPDEDDPDHGHADHESDSFAIGVRSTELVNDQGAEVVPQTSVLDALDFDASDFDRLVRGGVTTVYVSPDPSAVIGARGTVVHTAGSEKERVLVPAGAVKATIGSEPSRLGTSNRPPSRTSLSMYARRPNSRMGLVWVFRKAFYDARRRDAGVDAYGSDTASPEATAVLADVLDKKVPLRIQARLQRDILTALRLSAEFQLDFTLEEATEAYRCIDELKQRRVPVVFGPIYETASGIRLRSGEGRRSRYFTFRALLDAGITTALSAQEFREENGLARQVMYAMRFGVSFDDALRAVTVTPAGLIGLADQIGSVEVGKRADLVVWNGQPFAAASRMVTVLIDGNVVVDRR